MTPPKATGIRPNITVAEFIESLMDMPLDKEVRFELVGPKDVPLEPCVASYTSGDPYVTLHFSVIT